MKLKLLNTDFLSTGIFGFLEDEKESILLYTLQHAYPVISQIASVETTYAPKILPGTYTCIRGVHRIPHHSDQLNPIMAEMGAKLVTIDGQRFMEFETFEITGVEGHSNLLFHPGCYNIDSLGCVLTGLARQGNEMILNSVQAFQKLMNLQKGCDSFALTVS